MNSEQKQLYEAVRKWLESQGFQVLVTGGEPSIVVPVADVLPTRVHMIPDMVGIKEKDSMAAIVEVETNMDKILEVIGKCMVWKLFATLVYIAYPLEKCRKFSILEKLGLGLLGVSQQEVREVVKIMPTQSGELFRVLELHPLDFSKQTELIRLVKGILQTEHG